MGVVHSPLVSDNNKNIFTKINCTAKTEMKKKMKSVMNDIWKSHKYESYTFKYSRVAIEINKFNSMLD